MNNLIYKRLLMVIFVLFVVSTTIAQTKLIAYSFNPGNIATNGQTTLWSSVGGYSTGGGTSGSTTLNPGVLAEGLATKTVLSVLDELEYSISIYQNLNTNEVIIRNSTSYGIESVRILNVEGKLLKVEFEHNSYGNANLSFSTNFFRWITGYKKVFGQIRLEYQSELKPFVCNTKGFFSIENLFLDYS